jgi:hypothetical protein
MKIVIVTTLLLVGSSARAEKFDAEIAALAKKQAPDTKRVGEILAGQADKKGGRTDWHVELDSSNCYWLIGHGDASVQKISLFLYGPDESLFSGRSATTRSNDNTAVLMNCPEKTGMHRAQLKVTEGHGAYELAIYAKPAPKKEPERDLLAEQLAKEAKSVAPGAQLVGDVYAGDDERADWFTELEKGKCYWVIAVGSDDIDELYLYLWDGDNNRITDSKAKANKTSLGHCAKETGMYKVQIKVNDGDGPYRVGVYSKAKG